MPERRVDPSDGNEYTREEFESHYGKGCRQWPLALEQQRAAAVDIIPMADALPIDHAGTGRRHASRRAADEPLAATAEASVFFPWPCHLRWPRRSDQTVAQFNPWICLLSTLRTHAHALSLVQAASSARRSRRPHPPPRHRKRGPVAAGAFCRISTPHSCLAASPTRI